jgi:multidrug efflux pump subunit AcrA (membrane-fusion protein)
VDEIFVEHGQSVTAGQPLAVLNDPDLSLLTQQVLGEIDAVGKQLEAINVARTDRGARENQTPGRLPLSSEDQLLRERLASLERQRELLRLRREALTIRSPISGQVLTRDVQSLLESRPVQRGQALMTVADVDAPWTLVADVPQRKIGRIVDAREQGAPLTVRFRLAGDLDETRVGRVAQISEAAVLDAEGLLDQPPPVEVTVHIEEPLPKAARPGMNATVRIHCGKRSLGYVWLYDVGATLYRWWAF